MWNELYTTFDDVLLVPKYSDIETRTVIDISTTLGKVKLKVPIMSANMDYVTEYSMAAAMDSNGAFYALHRFYGSEESWSLDISKFFFRDMPVSFSIGIRHPEKELEKIWHVAEFDYSRPPIFVFIDVAHGHHKKVLEMIPKVKDIIPEAFVVAGNIATKDGFRALYDAGADGVKVGIGPGSVCTTRTVAGVGVPQLSAIATVAHARDEWATKDIAIIADGGFRSSGDIVKALAAGADVAMLGYLLAGANESSAPSVLLGNKLHKRYRGQSTIGVNFSRETPEGVEGYVLSSGPVSGILNNLSAGIRSGCSYLGARNLEELRRNAEFIRVSPHTLVENQTRVVLL